MFNKKSLAKYALGIFLILFFTVFLVPMSVGVTETPPNYIVLKSDFHVHTLKSNESGGLSPTEVVKLYANNGFNVVAITDHGTISGTAEARQAGLLYNITVITGEEVSYRFTDGSYKHIIALFINKNIWSSSWNLNDLVKPIFDSIHSQGGFGIAAHPLCNYPKPSEPNWNKIIAQTPEYIDGFEYYMGSTSTSGTKLNSWLVNSNYTTIIGSDFHKITSTFGTKYTLVIAHNNTVAGVKEALFAGRTLAVINGITYGSAQNLALYDSIINPPPVTTATSSTEVVTTTYTTTTTSVVVTTTTNTTTLSNVTTSIPPTVYEVIITIPSTSKTYNITFASPEEIDTFIQYLTTGGYTLVNK
jgi:hypothetical protein